MYPVLCFGLGVDCTWIFAMLLELVVLLFYGIIHLCIFAILSCNDLAYYFPTAMEDINDAADSFKTISGNGATEGCVACIDGFYCM
jgi:hypothetical protein